MEIEVSLPLDGDGFLRRECPHCLRRFKWHDGPANEEAESQPVPSAYHCPFCGQPAGNESWFTTEQVEFLDAAAAPAIAQLLDDQLDKVFRGASSKHVKFKRTGRMEAPPHPDPLAEPDDMVIVASPCHGYEPIKVPEDASGPLFCLVCGAAFAL
jgi:hypothetical protein